MANSPFGSRRRIKASIRIKWFCCCQPKRASVNLDQLFNRNILINEACSPARLRGLSLYLKCVSVDWQLIYGRPEISHKRPRPGPFTEMLKHLLTNGQEEYHCEQAESTFGMAFLPYHRPAASRMPLETC